MQGDLITVRFFVWFFFFAFHYKATIAGHNDLVDAHDTAAKNISIIK